MVVTVFRFENLKYKFKLLFLKRGSDGSEILKFNCENIKIKVLFLNMVVMVLRFEKYKKILFL